jgi:hypothetical protein
MSPRECRRGRRFARRIDRAFVRGASPRVWRALRRHIRDCESCRARFDRLALIERAMSPATPFPSAAAERVASDLTPVRDLDRSAVRWAGAGLAAVAAVAALLLLCRAREHAPHDLQARGHGEERSLVPGERQPGVRLFCVTTTGELQRVLDEAAVPETTIPALPLRCILDADLQLAYSTPSLRGLTMVAFARDPEGNVQWYAPRAAADQSIALDPDRVDEPLDWSTRLAVRHAPGTYEIHVRFFRGPVSATAAAEGTVTPVYSLRGRMVVSASEVSP